MRASLQKKFEDISWSGRNGQFPRSGPGSTLERTENLRNALPQLFERYKVTRFLDAPCGDWFWMQHVDLTGIDYTGGDISKSIVDANAAAHTSEAVRFMHLDITSDPLPAADMMMCRDCLFHLKWFLRWDFFRNFLASDIDYLLMTIGHVDVNRRLMKNGAYVPFNPMKPPFNFPEPLEDIMESEGYVPVGKGAAKADLSIGLWSRDQVAAAVQAHDAAKTATPDPDSV